MTRVKICGCRTPEQAIWAAEAGADFVGIMFAAQSRRRVDPSDAYDIVRALGTPITELEMDLPPAAYRGAGDDLRSWYEQGAAALERLLLRKRPLTVGVFAGNDPEEINEIVDECGLDLVQLSGGEPWASCLLVARQVIKAVHVAGADTDETVAGRLETGSATAVLLDRASGGQLGGTGLSLDWQVAAGVSSRLPVWLAGGLSPENVTQAIATVAPWCVDVSSGVESDGVKDAAKVRAFVRAARAAA